MKLLFLCSGVTASLDSILAEVGKQSALGLSGMPDKIQVAQTFFSRQAQMLDDDEFRDQPTLKVSLLRGLIEKARKAIDSLVAKIDRKDARLLGAMAFLYCPRLARYFYDSIKMRGPAEEHWLEIFSGPGGYDLWMRKVFSLIDIKPKLDGIEKVLSDEKYTVETEGAIASVAVWKPLLLTAGMPQENARLHAIIDAYGDRFLLQRKELGIPINRDNMDVSSLDEFLELDRLASDKFKEVYEDYEIAQLVKSLSTQIAFKSVSSRFSALEKRQWVSWRLIQTDMDDSLAQKLTTREIPMLAGSLDGRETLPSIQALKGIAMTPKIAEKWIADLEAYQLQPSTRDQATRLIEELSDVEALKAERRQFYTLDELESKVLTVSNILESLSPSIGTLAVIHCGVLVNIAMWFSHVVKQSRSHQATMHELLLRGIMAEHIKHFALQRNILALPSFTFDAKKNTMDQVDLFLEDEQNMSNDPYIPLFFTIEEADAMRRTSLFVEIMGTIGRIKIAVEFSLVKQLQKRIFRRP